MKYEELCNRLEQIVKELENDNLELDKASKLFEEAVNISKELKSMLETQKGKITQILQKNNKENIEVDN